MADQDAIPIGDADDEPIDLSAEEEEIDLEEGETSGARIQTFGKQKRHDEKWDRTPNTTGTGAIHVKTFHAKLREDALEYMDQQINEWLDAHPEYEVKFVTTSIGELKSKSMTEQALFMNVWV
jgi:hypothetical protein